MALLFKKLTVGCKSEAIQGTAVNMTPVDYIQVYDATVKPSLEILERDIARQSLDTLPSQVGKAFYDVSFKAELKNTGSAGLVYQPFDAIMKACGFTASVAAGVSVTYTPTSYPSSSTMNGPFQSMTVEVVRDGKRRVIDGVVGTFKLSLEANKIGMLDFSGKGMFALETDAVMPNMSASNGILPPTCESIGLTVSGSSNFIPSKFEIDMGQTVTEIASVNSVDGIYGFQITKRQPKGSFDPLTQTVAQFDALNKIYNSAQFSLSATIGSVAGNKVSISAPLCQLGDLQDVSRNDLYAWQLPLLIRGSGSLDNSIQIQLL